MVGDDFYSLAERLLAGGTPADYRSSISRAYYGVYHNAQELLRRIGIRMKGGAECHGKLKMILDMSGDADVILLASKLSELRQTRNAADYNLGNASYDKLPKAVLEVKGAEKLIADIKSHFPSGGYTAMHDKLRQQAKLMGEHVT